MAGTVVLRAVLSSNGKVADIKVVRGLPDGLTEQAIKAAQNIKFVPAMIGDRPVSQYVQIEYNFSLFDYEELAAQTISEAPLIPEEAKPILSRIYRENGVVPKTIAMVLWQQLAAGLRKLSIAEQFEFDRLRSGSIATLTAEEQESFAEVSRKSKFGQRLTADEAQRVDEVVKKAIKSLPDADLQRLRELTLKALQASVNTVRSK